MSFIEHVSAIVEEKLRGVKITPDSPVKLPESEIASTKDAENSSDNGEHSPMRPQR